MSKRLYLRQVLLREAKSSRRFLDTKNSKKRQGKRPSVMPARDAQSYSPEWSIEWVHPETAARQLSQLVNERQFLSLYFHGDGQSFRRRRSSKGEAACWDLLEIGLVDQQRTLLVDGSCRQVADLVRETLKDVSVRIFVSDVMRICPQLLSLDLSPHKIVDVHLRAVQLYPWLRHFSFFSLCEQLLGIYVEPKTYSGGWARRPLSALHLQNAGLGAELCVRLYESLHDQKTHLGEATGTHLSCVK